VDSLDSDMVFVDYLDTLNPLDSVDYLDLDMDYFDSNIDSVRHCELFGLAHGFC